MSCRRAVSRPDVPDGLDAGDLILARTPGERAMIDAGIDRYVAELEAGDEGG